MGDTAHIQYYSAREAANLPAMIIDSFAGGGGASTGIELALGRSPDVAINHSTAALALHAANHPETLHLDSNIWDVKPREVTRGRRVGLLWASPDCKHFSKAKGGAPRDRNIRDLAWVAVDWAEQVKRSHLTNASLGRILPLLVEKEPVGIAIPSVRRRIHNPRAIAGFSMVTRGGSPKGLPLPTGGLANLPLRGHPMQTGCHVHHERRRPAMAERIRFSSDPLDDPVCDILARCEEMEALLAACVALFGEIKPLFKFDLAEASALPVLISLVDNCRAEISASATRLDNFFSNGGSQDG